MVYQKSRSKCKRGFFIIIIIIIIIIFIIMSHLMQGQWKLYRAVKNKGIFWFLMSGTDPE